MAHEPADLWTVSLLVLLASPNRCKKLTTGKGGSNFFILALITLLTGQSEFWPMNAELQAD